MRREPRVTIMIFAVILTLVADEVLGLGWDSVTLPTLKEECNPPPAIAPQQPDAAQPPKQSLEGSNPSEETKQ